MADVITLYRGDPAPVEEFEFKKTNKYCLVGQGIYLTSSKRVGNSYRIKGTTRNHYQGHMLFSGVALNKTDAYEKAFKSFVEHRNPVLFRVMYPPKWARKTAFDKKHQAKLEALQKEYRCLLSDGLITAEYKSSVEKLIEVSWNSGETVGELTVFQFGRREFELGVCDLSETRDPGFWELMYDHQIKVGTPYADKESYIRNNIGRYTYLSNATKETFVQMRNALVPYGYRGFEYRGGAIMGGLGNHRAFCIWDEEYVNRHIVTREKA